LNKRLTTVVVDKIENVDRDDLYYGLIVSNGKIDCGMGGRRVTDLAEKKKLVSIRESEAREVEIEIRQAGITETFATPSGNNNIL
jgi:hypothetical protein